MNPSQDPEQPQSQPLNPNTQQSPEPIEYVQPVEPQVIQPQSAQAPIPDAVSGYEVNPSVPEVATPTPAADPMQEQSFTEPVVEPVVTELPVAAVPETSVSDVASLDGMDTSVENPDRQYLTLLLLSVLFGSVGIDRIYLGKTKTGILKFISAGGLGIWYLIDIIRAVLGKATVKGDARKLDGYQKNRSWAGKALIIFVIYFVVMVIASIALAFISSTSDMTNGGFGEDTNYTIEDFDDAIVLE